MDWVSRFLGLPVAAKKPPARASHNDPETRLARYKRVYHTILALCNQPRNLITEGPLLDQLDTCLSRLSTLIREEARNPTPHLCVQFSNVNHVYALVGRAATVSQHPGIVRSAVGIFAALADSEEEDFLSSGPFAKSLMRLVTKVVDYGTNPDTETAILELLFTIAAKIRLQPEILGVWFQHRSVSSRDSGELKEKQNFVGYTQKEDFPLCYLLIDRVHNEGRIGDFARTGLLYILEATGRSRELETWILSSDLPTLMASGLGALYSQLSRELSILHPDAALPAVLALSDYSTTHTRATAESAFSERHRAHMATFLSYLAFWQDILDHCRSEDVRDTLLDHFQILFLKQLLYPSLLQSSDTDAGSSIAVLTYLTAMLESLDYPDLMHMMLAYLLAMPDDDVLGVQLALPSVLARSPRSPKALRRRQSLLLWTAPENPDEFVEPTLFNLIDLILNNVRSRNSQSVFASLQLASTIISRQKKYALGTLLKVERKQDNAPVRTIGALHLEVEKLTAIGVSYHELSDLDEAYTSLCYDIRFCLEAQVPFTAPDPFQPAVTKSSEDQVRPARYILQTDDPLLKTLRELLKTFWTNSIDVNLALTQAIESIARCAELSLEGWLALDPANYQYPESSAGSIRPWHIYLDGRESLAVEKSLKASIQPIWPSNTQAPTLYGILQGLATEIEAVRKKYPTLDTLVASRKNILQGAGVSIPPTPNITPPTSPLPSPTYNNFLDVPPRPSRSAHGGRSSRSVSPQPRPRTGDGGLSVTSALRSIFLPPPPDTPSTTDLLTQNITFPIYSDESNHKGTGEDQKQANGERRSKLTPRSASLNHILTNVVILQEFVLELAAVCQVRGAVLGDAEVKFVV